MAPFRLIRGEEGRSRIALGHDHIKLLFHTNFLDSYGIPEGRPITKGKVFYELEILSNLRTARGLKVGWADSTFDSTMTSPLGTSNQSTLKVVGDEPSCWVVDGHLSKKHHNSVMEPFKLDVLDILAQGWKEGDVIGVAADLDNFVFHIGKNGSFKVVYHMDGFRPIGGIFPIISGDCGVINIRLGHRLGGDIAPSRGLLLSSDHLNKP